MLRRVLMILVCWPLLLPPGLCVCRPEAFAFATAGRPVVAEGRDRPTTPVKRCRCCRPAGKPSVSRDAVAPATPAPDGPHAPGCPASPTWEVARSSLPVGDRLDHYPAALGVALVSWCCHADTPLDRPAPDVAPLPPSVLPLFSCNFRC